MNELIKNESIENMIYEIRGIQVMLDSDLAKLYCCSGGTKDINRAVKNNPNKFPERYSWILNDEELNNLRLNFFTANISNKSRSNPRVFTEQGVYMLSTILKSIVATEVSIRIMDTFVKIRHYIPNVLVEQKYINNLVIKNDERLTLIEKAIDKMTEKEKHSLILYDGEVYDAYSLLIDIFNKSTKEIIIIDNYISKELLDLLRKYDKSIIIISNYNDDLLMKKYIKQYKNIIFINNNTFHDRFILIDRKILYHSGASFKDLGKKCFAINLIEDKEEINKFISNLKIILKLVL